jgi:hypothetical protein
MRYINGSTKNTALMLNQRYHSRVYKKIQIEIIATICLINDFRIRKRG